MRLDPLPYNFHSYRVSETWLHSMKDGRLSGSSRIGHSGSGLNEEVTGSQSLCQRVGRGGLSTSEIQIIGQSSFPFHIKQMLHSPQKRYFLAEGVSSFGLAGACLPHGNSVDDAAAYEILCIRSHIACVSVPMVVDAYFWKHHGNNQDKMPAQLGKLIEALITQNKNSKSARRHEV